MRVAINGFGRIGRMVLRSLIASPRENIDIVAINDLMDPETAIHLLKYDSVHGSINFDQLKLCDESILINDKSIKYFSQRSPEELPWEELKIDLVLECSGFFNKKNDAQKHIKAGAKKVLISAPSEDCDRTIVYGVNNKDLQSTDLIVSNASCTTNCLAPLVKCMQESVGIINGFAMTIHSYTGDQRLVDTAHSDIRRARSAAQNMIPTYTGATKAIEVIYPQLAGKISGLSVRVPTIDVSILDFSFRSSRKTSVDEVNEIISFNSKNDFKNIIGYTEEKLVSSDFIGDSRSCIFDASLTKVVDSDSVHMIAWYDNEYGFANRMIDLANLMF